MIGFRLTVYGPATSLHSGHYGNVAPNPGRAPRRAHRLDAADGRPHHGRRASAPPPSPAVLALARDGFDTTGMLASAGVGTTESGLAYGESILRPSLNVTQLLYGGAGAQRNAIDAEATAGFDLRLVPGMTVRAHARPSRLTCAKQGYALVDAPPTAEERVKHAKLAHLDWGDDGYPAAMSPPDEPRRCARDRGHARGDGRHRAHRAAHGRQPADRADRDVLKTPFVIVPIVNADNNQHAPNENLRMAEFRRGIALYAALLAAAGRGW